MDGRIEVLGPVRLRVCGDAIEPRGSLGRTVAALLAAEVDTVVSLDQLIAAMWDEAPPTKAVASVRSAVSRLRSSLPSGAIVSHGSGAGYSLTGELVSVDLRELEAVVAASGEGETGELAAVESAMDLWRGPPFEGVSATPVFAAYRDHAREMQAVLVQRHRSLLIEHGDAGRALDLLRGDVAVDPLDEPLRMLHVAALLALGRDDEARRSARDYRELLSDRTGLDPSPAFLRLEHRIHRETADLTPADPAGSGAEIIGRGADVERVVTALATPGVVSLVGLGGVGKTTVLKAALHQLGRPSRVIALEGVDPAADVVAAIGAALGSQGVGEDSVNVLLQRFEVTRTVVALDSCEHLLGRVRAFIDDVPSRFPALTLATTSRVPIGVAGERVLRIDPLAIESGSATSPAAELFRARAAQAGARLATDDATAASVRSICAALGGLPLAIELAAARAVTVGLDELRRRLPEDLSVLRPGMRRERRAHSTVDDVIEWSLASLPDEALVLLRQLAVFPAGFSLTAVEAVSGNPRAAAPLGVLLSHSVVSSDANDRGHHQLRLLSPVRAVVRQRIPAEEWMMLRGTHAEWTVTLGDEVVDLWCEGHAREAVELVSRHRADFEAAFRLLALRRDATTLERLAAQITPLFTGYRDLALMDLLAEVCTTSTAAGEAALAHLVLARRPLIDSAEFAERTIGHARRAAELAASGSGGFHAEVPWAYGLLVRGHLEEVVDRTDGWLRRPDVGAREAAQLAAIQALALVSLGRVDDARTELARRSDVVDAVPSGGLVELARSYAAGDDLEVAVRHCRAAIDEANADRAPVLRLIHQEQLLWLFVSEGRTLDGAALALMVVPGQLEAGLRQVAWVTLRVVAKLLLDAGLVVDAATIAAASAKGASHTPLDRHVELEAAVMATAIEQLGAERVALIERGASPNLAQLWVEVERALTLLVESGGREGCPC